MIPVAGADEKKKPENDLNKRVLEALGRLHQDQELPKPVEQKTEPDPAATTESVEEKPLPVPDDIQKNEEPNGHELKPASVTQPITKVAAHSKSETGISVSDTSNIILPKTYKVAAGDTFSGIAYRLYGDEARWVAIAKANPLVDPIRLKIGQELKLPDLKSDHKRSREEFENVKDSITIPATKSQIVFVEPGDTLSGIAYRMYGKASLWRLIFDANRDKLRSPDRVQVGMKLKVPPLAKLQPAAEQQVKIPAVKAVETD
jgi:nucleoid-associated protein YgaU